MIKEFFKFLFSILMEISYSEDNSHIIYSNKFFRLKFKRHTYNWYKSFNDEKIIKNYLNYKKTRNASSVVYTCILNDYDDIEEIRTHVHVNKDWDYVLFTDNQSHIRSGQIGIWEVHPLQYTDLDDTRNNRWHKLNPHLLFPQYKESIYLDANIVVLTPYLFKIIKKKDNVFILPRHYKNNCIYSEYKDVTKLKLDNNDLIEKELEIIKKSGMPRNYGFCENNILYRRHNEDIVKKIDEEWWYMVKNYAKRDQLSLCYLFWKYGLKIKDITFKNSRLDHKNFFVMIHKKGRKQ